VMKQGLKELCSRELQMTKGGGLRCGTGTVGAGIDFSEKHFDVTFAIIGCSSTIECQFQLIHRVRHTNKNLLYLWIDKPGKGGKGILTKKQIC